MLKKIRTFFKEYKQLGVVIIVMIVALGLDIGGLDTVAHWLLGITAIVNAIILLWGMFQDLRSGSYGLDILAATAIITSVIMHEYWAGMVIVLMLTGGEALEDYAEARAKTELTALMKRKPKKAHVLRGRKVQDVTVDKVQVSDKLRILPGEVVPVDCVLLEGATSFDESSLTGESLPVTKQVGGEILSGSINIEGAITVRALRTSGDSQYEQIIKLVNSATSSQSPFVRLADRYSIPFTIIAFVIAGGAWYLSGDSLRFLQVLVVATPCPLLLGAPIALISGMSRAARQGIIVKTGSAIERLADVKTMAFDKTGTLTKGMPVVATVQSFGKFTKKDVLSYAASVEQASSHILAKAIVNEATAKKIKLIKPKQVTEQAGHGLSGKVQAHSVWVGRNSALKEMAAAMPKNFKTNSIKTTATYVVVDGTLAGVITFTDELRAEAKATLKALHLAGIKQTLMVTGDNATTAKAIAKQVGIDTVEADCLPADKLRIIESLTNRPVGFVGDGVNDAPVLAASEVGIALGARGSTAASESADVVIMMDDLGKVATGVRIAKRTFRIAKQAIMIGIVISIGLMFIFATGRFKPIYGAAIQELVDVTVIIYALRAHGPFHSQKDPLA